MNPAQLLRIAALIMLAHLLTGCAGMETGYDTPAQAGQISYNLHPVTAPVLRDLQFTLPEPPMAPPTGPTHNGYAYHIGPADILVIHYDQPIFDESTDQSTSAMGQRTEARYVVSEQGEIFLPLYGRLKVGGLTITEAYQEIIAALENFVTNPEINVTIADFRSQQVTVAGAATSVNYLPVTNRPMTIIDAVFQAGAEGNADLRNVVLKRDGEQINVDVSALMDSPDFGRDWVLQDGDVVSVPENTNKVYLLGAGPNTNTSIEPYRTSLAEVLIRGRSGGDFLQAAQTDLGSIFVIRGDIDFVDVYHLNARTPDAVVLAENFPMQDGDIVFVTTRPVTRFNRYVSEMLPSLAPLLFVDSVRNRL